MGRSVGDHDSDLVPQVVAATVLQRDLTNDPAPAALAHHFPESTLLTLDNCEQVVDGCADLIVALLARSQSLRVIATSRQPLGVPGEQVWRVGGLAVTEDDPTDEDAHAQSDQANERAPDDPDDGAVSLFIERAAEASSRFDPGAPGVRDTIRRICRWLDGMPLPIELAAARVPVLSLSQIADRLERDASVLRHTSRTAPERHRTLDATLEWSHRMLEAAEQRLFRRLGAFRGTFSLTAAEYVSGGYQLDAAEVLDLLAVLIDRSLVQVVDQPEDPRYRLLSTVRQYAAAKLWDTSEARPSAGGTRSSSRRWRPRRTPGSPGARSSCGSSASPSSTTTWSRRSSGCSSSRSRRARRWPRCCGRSGTCSASTTSAVLAGAGGRGVRCDGAGERRGCAGQRRALSRSCSATTRSRGSGSSAALERYFELG